MRVPSTQALRALDAFARHGSVWKAAGELHLTRSAVSHQLRLLERELGFELLRRVGKGVALTAPGRRYAGDVRQALATIGNAAVKHGETGIGGPLTVSCTAGFASLWLCPQIAEFHERYPDIALRILTPGRLDEVDQPDVDVFIAFGYGNWPNRRVEPLSEVEFTPLCSPALLHRLGGLSEPADVLLAPLLHLGDFEDWTRWLALAKVENPAPESGIVFSDLNLVVAATAAGQGIALGDELTSGKALNAGQLVRPFELGFKSSRAYYLVADHRRSANPAADAFGEWLRLRLGKSEAVARPVRP